MNNSIKTMLVGAFATLCAFTASAAPGERYVGGLFWPYAEVDGVDGFVLPVLGMQAHEDLCGAGIAGFGLLAKDLDGAYIAGGGVKAIDRFRGFGLALGCAGAERMYGCAMGLFTKSEYLEGCGLSLIGSIGGEVIGFQSGLLFNYAEPMTGCQIALLNFAETFTGCQIGFVNHVYGPVTGCQIGLVNNSGEKLYGVQIGLVNICPETLCLPFVNVRF